MKGFCTTRCEWSYPDTPLAPLPSQVCLETPRGGRPGLQLLWEARRGASICVEGDGTELFRMIAIPVDYNTAPDTAPDKHYVDLFDECPPYATRKAPFEVYDCLAPLVNGDVQIANDRAAVYITFSQAGTHTVTLTADGASFCLTVQVDVLPLEIPERNLNVTNWFKLNNMATYHNLPIGSPEHAAMCERYARMMRRVRQTHFFIMLDDRCIIGRDPWEFSFEYATPFIEAFFRAGLTTMEIGMIVTRAPDWKGSRFFFTPDPSVEIDTEEGYETLIMFLKALAAYLKRHDWLDKTIFHISDEPDVHTENPDYLEKRRMVYYEIGNQLRKYIPGAQIIEAVKTPLFRGGVDIWVPMTPTLEKYRELFNRRLALGEELWTYVCCIPGGRYLNRLMDMPLIRNQLLFWCVSAYRLTGFLHWGFNAYGAGMDPFKRSSSVNNKEKGANAYYPCGDSFIVYPGTDGPWPSIRLEVQRRGTEDWELLNRLRKKNPERYEALVTRMVRSNTDYCEDPDVLQETRRELWRLLLD